MENMGVEGGAEEASEFKRSLISGFVSTSFGEFLNPTTPGYRQLLLNWPGNLAQPLDATTQAWNLLPHSCSSLCWSLCFYCQCKAGQRGKDAQLPTCPRSFLTLPACKAWGFLHLRHFP